MCIKLIKKKILWFLLILAYVWIIYKINSAGKIGSSPALAFKFQRNNMFLPCSLVEIQYCSEPPWQRALVRVRILSLSSHHPLRLIVDEDYNGKSRLERGKLYCYLINHDTHAMIQYPRHIMPITLVEFLYHASSQARLRFLRPWEKQSLAWEEGITYLGD